MSPTSTPDATEVVDFYEQINELISQCDIRPEQIRYIVQLGADTKPSKFIAKNHRYLLKNWPSFIDLSIQLNNWLFLEVFLSGLRKFMSQRRRKEIAAFLTEHDRRMEKEFPQQMQNASHEEMEKIVTDYTHNRGKIHEVAKNSLEASLNYDHHAKKARA